MLSLQQDPQQVCSKKLEILHHPTRYTSQFINTYSNVIRKRRTTLQNVHIPLNTTKSFATNLFCFLVLESSKLLSRVQHNSNVMTPTYINIFFLKLSFAIQKNTSGASIARLLSILFYET